MALLWNCYLCGVGVWLACWGVGSVCGWRVGVWDRCVAGVLGCGIGVWLACWGVGSVCGWRVGVWDRCVAGVLGCGIGVWLACWGVGSVCGWRVGVWDRCVTGVWLVCDWSGAYMRPMCGWRLVVA
ncbi:hypothetical protein HELRODRAFT_172430 [Helobdella robusta]|uniref:Uncharacterized protein n=1 Tax=Helobdella robusta TaxID=6412 RepID=T1F5B6_HELRO|nr:hypothetical protein HELRODRAFT_172430 [Helobdella robusta]ESO04758.1 hypothetical protein HELRODRAFT_172430 [Helobdella robusta]